MGVKLLMVLTNHNQLGDTGKPTGWYLPEVAHPYHVFKKAGYEITMCSPKGGEAPLDPGSADAFKNDQQCQDLMNNEEAIKELRNTLPIKDINAADYKIIFFPGGHGPMFDLADDKKVNEATTHIYENGGIVCAVCHGTVGIANTKLSNGDYLIKGQEVTSFTNSEENVMQLMSAMPFALESKLVENGASFKGAADWAENVVVSGRIITGQNPASASKMAEEVVKAVGAP